MGNKTKDDAENHPEPVRMIGLRLVGGDCEEFEDFLDKNPALNAHAAARLAVAVGVEALRADPERVNRMLAERRVNYSIGRRR